MEDKDLKTEENLQDIEHGHDHDHDHDHEHDYEDFDIINLTLEDDSEIQCAVLNVFEVEDTDYIALLPIDDEDEDLEEKEVLLYRFTELNDEEIEINMIETEEEFEKVAEKYYEINADFEDEDSEE